MKTSKESGVDLLLFIGLILWHSWMTLTLFGSQNAWKRLWSRDPIVSGKHPLHLYHGTLGARSLRLSGSLTCYDPGFQAGYPKTPVFDPSSRPAELCLLFANGAFSPLAYKIGVALCSLIVPFVFGFTALCCGWSRCARFLSAFLGSLVWWSRPTQLALHEGRIDLLFGTMIALMLMAMHLYFHRAPRARHWPGFIAFGSLGSYIHPTLFLILFPLLLIYYLTVGAKHRPVWHVLLACAVTMPLVCNLFWLFDWIEFWWLRMPFQVAEEMLPHRTPATFWGSPLWGSPLDRALALFLVPLGIIGTIMINEHRDRVTARVLGLGLIGFLVLGVGGILNRSLGRFSTSHLYVSSLMFAVPLAAFAVDRFVKMLSNSRPRQITVAVLATGLLAFLGWQLEGSRAWTRLCSAKPFEIGLTEPQWRLIAELRAHTTNQARSRWQDCPEKSDSHWSCLLPMFSDRTFMGGLDREESIEHTVGGLTRNSLGRRELSSWTLEQFREYCRQYNIGWIACWSDEMKRLLSKWKISDSEKKKGTTLFDE